MSHHKFNPEHSHKLDNPQRRNLLPPELVLKDFGPNARETWADIGCGNGYFTLPLATKVEKIFALDVSPKMLSELRERLDQQGICNVEAIPTAETELPLMDIQVDTVLLSLVAHELDKPQESFVEFARILKPGGRLFIIEWIKAPMELGPPFEHRLTSQEVTNWAKQADLDSGRSWEWSEVFMGMEFLKS